MSELFAIAPTLAMIFVFVLGTIIGSFLNVVIYRLHTGKSLAGSSHCLSCGQSLRWYDLFPVLSFVCLRGRCRQCGCRFTARYAVVEIITGLLFVASLNSTLQTVPLVLLWIILSLLVVITVYDLRHYIIPDVLTLWLTVFVLGYVYTSAGYSTDVIAYLPGLLAALAGAGFLFFLWFISNGRWLGFGDVKLVFPLGLLVGADLVFSFIVWSFWIGAGFSLLLVALAKFTRGKLRLPFLPSSLTIKSTVPFAPFLVAGCLLVFFLKLNVLTLFTI